MVNPLQRCLVLAGAIALVGSACGDLLEPEVARTSAESESVRTRSEGVVVTTRFVVDGIDELDHDVALERLYLHVGAVFLEPVAGSDAAVSFTNREPFALDFDVEAGEVELFGPEMVLPFGGDFAVSVQIEPGDVTFEDDKSLPGLTSLEASGHWYETTVVADGLDTDEPSPLPWTPKGLSPHRTIAEPIDFVYRSSEVTRMQVGEVRLADDGEYELTLTLRVDGWLRGDLLPALRTHAADSRDRPDVANRFEGTEVDVDGALSDEDVGLDGLVGDMDLSAQAY